MRIFKTHVFARFARREDIRDAVLRAAIMRAEMGLVDADLGGGVIKLRLAREGQGRSRGYRAIVLFRRGERAIFVYGFAKKDRQNIRGDELIAFRRLAAVMLALDDVALAAAIRNGTIQEVDGDGNAIQE